MTNAHLAGPATISRLAVAARFLLALLAFGSLVVVAVAAGRYSSEIGSGRAAPTAKGLAFLLAAVFMLAAVGIGWLALAAYDRLVARRPGFLLAVGTALVLLALVVAVTTRGIGAANRLGETVACEFALFSLVAAASALRSGRLLAAVRRPALPSATEVVNG